MSRSTIDFQKISAGLTKAIETVKAEQNSLFALSELKNAQDELQKAIAFHLHFKKV